MLKKKIAKWSIIFGAITVISSALISANFASAETKSGIDMSKAGAAAKQIWQQILEIFAYSETEYNDNYIAKDVMPSNQKQTTLAKTTLQDSSMQSQSYITEKVMNVPNAFKQAQDYTGIVARSSNGQPNQDSAQEFNFGNLLNTLTLQSGKEKQAFDMIMFLSDATDPIQTLNLNTNKSTIPSVASYYAQLGTYALQKSVGVNPFFTFIEERKPKQELNNMSVLEYDAKNATRRMQSKWYQYITSDKFTAADAAREQLVILAEQRYEMFAIRMQLEQLNATLATFQLQMQQGVNKPRLMLSKTAAKSASSGN